MSKTCILFSGQGSQYQGMGKEILELFPSLNYIYECGSDMLGFDLKKTAFEADAQTLAQTQISQPTIFATSVVCFEAFKTLNIEISSVAGHSLGEYAAMVSSQMLSLEDGFSIIKNRAYAMNEGTKSQSGAMAAVIGLSSDEVLEICSSVGGYVVPVNFNSPVQTVVAGELEAVDSLIQKVSAMKKRAMKLAVSAAFHSKLMQPSADIFYDLIKDYKFKKPCYDFYSNLTGNKIADFSDMPNYLKSHLVSPVLFVDELSNIKKSGVDSFVECGPNKVLSGLVKKTLTDVLINNIEDEKSFNKTSTSLQG